MPDHEPHALVDDTLQWEVSLIWYQTNFARRFFRWMRVIAGLPLSLCAALGLLCILMNGNNATTLSNLDQAGGKIFTASVILFFWSLGIVVAVLILIAACRLAFGPFLLSPINISYTWKNNQILESTRLKTQTSGGKEKNPDDDDFPLGFIIFITVAITLTVITAGATLPFILPVLLGNPAMRKFRSTLRDRKDVEESTYDMSLLESYRHYPKWRSFGFTENNCWRTMYCTASVEAEVLRRFQSIQEQTKDKKPARFGFKYFILFMIAFTLTMLGPGIFFMTAWLHFIRVDWWTIASQPDDNEGLIYSRFLLIFLPELFWWLIFVWISGPIKAAQVAFALSFCSSTIIGICLLVTWDPLVDQYNACFSQSQYTTGVFTPSSPYCYNTTYYANGRNHTGSRICDDTNVIKLSGDLASIGSLSTGDDYDIYSLSRQWINQPVLVEYRKSDYGISIISVNHVGKAPICLLPAFFGPKGSSEFSKKQ